MPDYAGMPLVPSALCPLDKVYVVGGAVHYHARTSVTGRLRKPHGRTSGPKRWKIKTRLIEPAWVMELRNA